MELLSQRFANDTSQKEESEVDAKIIEVIPVLREVNQVGMIVLDFEPSEV